MRIFAAVIIGVHLLAPVKSAKAAILPSIHQIYLENRDRFELSCWLGESPVSVQKAMISRPQAAAEFAFKDKLLEIRMIFPSDSLSARDWLVPYPHHRFLIKTIAPLGTAADESLLRTSPNGLLDFNLSGVKGTCFVAGIQDKSVPFHIDSTTGFAHINVHPHKHYDPSGLLSGRITPILETSGIRHHVFLEAHVFPYDVSQYLLEQTSFGSLFWNPEAGVSLEKTEPADLHLAPSGKFLFLGIKPANIAPTVLVTGGYLNACIGQTLPFLSKTVFDSEIGYFRIGLIQSLLLKGPDSLMPRDVPAFEAGVRDSFAIICRREGWDCRDWQFSFHYYTENNWPGDPRSFLDLASRSPLPANPRHLVDFHVWWDRGEQ